MSREDSYNTDNYKPWATVMRERLRGKMTRGIGTIAEDLKEALLYQESITWHGRGLEPDLLAEGSYQGLVTTYSVMGEPIKALRVYDELQSLLFATFNLKPSQASQAIDNTLIDTKNELVLYFKPL